MSTTESLDIAPVVGPSRGPGWIEFVLGVVGYLVISVAVGVAAGLAGFSLTDGITVAIVTAVSTLVTVGAVLAVRVRSLAPLRLSNPGARWLFLGLVTGGAGAGIALGIEAVWVAITGDTVDPHQALDATAAAGGGGLVAMLALGAVVIPFAEELLFRGVLFSALRRYGAVPAVLGSVAVFGLFHGFPPLVCYAFLMGVAAAVLFERSQSIWPGVVVHVTSNTLGFLTVVLMS